jgi:hypothetical protein
MKQVQNSVRPAEALANLDADLERRRVQLWIARANRPLRELLTVMELTERLGQDNFYPSVRATITAYHARLSAP